MHLKTSILEQQINETELKVRCDESCKEILSNKEILARILKNVVPEFAQYKTEDIRDFCIEGDVQTSGNTPLITGMNNESTILDNGTYIYDVCFSAFYSKEEELKKVIIELEAQNQYPSKYEVFTRGIFYGSRMITSQYGREFTGDNYQDIKKVYSIWICMNPHAEDRNTISECVFVQKNKTGTPGDRAKEIDLIHVIKICLGGELSATQDKSGGIIRMLNVIFSNEVTAKEKLKILEQEYGICNEKLREEIEDMGGFYEYFYETGMKQGINQVIKAMIRTSHKYGASKEEIVNDIVSQFSKSRQDAEREVEEVISR